MARLSLQPEEDAIANEHIPPPMLPGNYQKAAASCLLGVSWERLLVRPAPPLLAARPSNAGCWLAQTPQALNAPADLLQGRCGQQQRLCLGQRAAGRQEVGCRVVTPHESFLQMRDAALGAAPSPAVLHPPAHLQRK